MSSLKRTAECLCGREELDEQTRHALVLNLKSLEEEWKGVLQNAQELHRSANQKCKINKYVDDSVSRVPINLF